MTTEPNGIPRFWKILFTVEIALCVATAAYWVTLPEDYALGLFGLREMDLGHRMLLQQNAAVLAFAYGWFYARLLYFRRMAGFVRANPSGRRASVPCRWEERRARA